jgi:hypothetical protein
LSQADSRGTITSAGTAAAEVRRRRATQFSPIVVDAFFAAFKRPCALVEPDKSYAVAVAVAVAAAA